MPLPPGKRLKVKSRHFAHLCSWRMGEASWMSHHGSGPWSHPRPGFRPGLCSQEERGELSSCSLFLGLKSEDGSSWLLWLFANHVRGPQSPILLWAAFSPWTGSEFQELNLASISSPMEVFLMPVRKSSCCNHPDCWRSEVGSKESVQLRQVSQNLLPCSHTVSTWKPHLGTVGGIVRAARDDQKSREHIHNLDFPVSTESQKALHLSDNWL